MQNTTFGDGLAHVGYVKATGFDLAAVNIHGDLGAIDVVDLEHHV